MKDCITIAFPFASPSGTKFRGRSGWKWLMNYNKKYDKFLKDYNLVKEWQAKEKRLVEIIRYVPSKRQFIKDKENLMFGCKALKDALNRAGLIKEDSMKWLEDVYYQEVGEAKTVVRITIYKGE